MIQFILQTLRQQAITNPTLFPIINTRFYPERVDLESDSNTYPLAMVSLLGGSVDQDNYPTDTLILDTTFVSDKTLDQAIEIYQGFRAIINRQVFREASTGNAFEIFEDSPPMDASMINGDKILYVFTNTWRVRTKE